MTNQPEENRFADDMIALRDRSGTVKSKDPLVAFLYELIRDHLPSGTVERLVLESSQAEMTYTNGWLVTYAQDLSDRLQRGPDNE